MAKTINVNQEDFEILAFCAFRYALGRKSYITGTVSDILDWYQEYLSINTIDMILKETNEAIDSGNAGMDMDVYEWTSLSAALSRRRDFLAKVIEVDKERFGKPNVPQSPGDKAA